MGHRRALYWWDMLVVPIVIFQTQSLVSIELSSSSGNSLELPDDCEIINLPNLKRLSLQFVSFRLQWIEKLIKACPSLEVLYLTRLIKNPGSLHQLQSLKCCNQSLRWLLIRTNFAESNSIVIKAPKLEYLDILAPKPGIFSFEEEPIARFVRQKSNLLKMLVLFLIKKTGLCQNSMGAVSNVRFLTLNISKVGKLSLVFRYATRLTFDMNVSQILKTMSSLLEMCPVLDVWTVDVLDTGKDNELSSLRALKRIHIDIRRWDYSYDKPTESFLDLIAYLLRNAPNLEKLNLSVNSRVYSLVGNDENNKARELMLSNLLFQCPMASTSCNVEFKGRYVKMSRKDCPS
ncbi:putative F-box/FBD/LRR-repeat protein At1g78760 [Silene latifolia]|uniref:putative F-box/FBD/LRR-repeat protein At1g78760 n=1 Tax=Silene latifolia TaxID=37657 RepID=UPI003D76EF81